MKRGNQIEREQPARRDDAPLPPVSVSVTTRDGVVRRSNRKRGFCTHTRLRGLRVIDTPNDRYSFPGNGQVVDPATPPTSWSARHGLPNSPKNPRGVGTCAWVGVRQNKRPSSKHCVHRCARLSCGTPASVMLPFQFRHVLNNAFLFNHWLYQRIENMFSIKPDQYKVSDKKKHVQTRAVCKPVGLPTLAFLALSLQE